MTLTLEELRDALSFRFKSMQIRGQIDPAMLDQWINRGIDWIVNETLCYESTATLTPDGTSSSFVIIGAGDQNIAADYLAMKSVDHANGIVKETSIDAIRRLEASSSITGGSPEYYALYADKIWFDHIPGATLTQNVQYYNSATALSVDTDTPTFPLNGMTRLILSAALVEYATDVGDENLRARQTQFYNLDVKDLTRAVEKKGKHKRHVGKTPYQVFD